MALKVKTYNNVQSNVTFSKASSRVEINPTAGEAATENIALTLGKISKWYDSLVPTGGSSGKFLGWNSSGTAKWVDAPTAEDKNMSQTLKTDNVNRPLLMSIESTSNTTATVTTTGARNNSMYGNVSTGLIFCRGREISNVTLKTGTTAQSHITLNTLMTWLITSKQYIPSGKYCHVVLTTAWDYANSDILQVSINSTNYEIQLAGVIIEFMGSATSYNAGTFRLLIHSSPTTSFTAATGYTKFPTATIAEYTCNGSSYSPVWKMILNDHPTITVSADTTSTTTLSHGGTFTAITSVTRDSNGHTTKVNTATYTLPAQYSHPTYTERTKDIYKFHVNTLGHVDDASTLDANDVSGLLNKLTTGSSTPTDADYYISQYVGGGTTTTSYHRRPMSALWSYINGKISATTSGSGNAVTSVSYANGVITATKGSTFLASTTKYAGSSSVGGPANLLAYSHTNEINFSGGKQAICYFNYRDADTNAEDTGETPVSINYKFCDYRNSTAYTTITAANFAGNASTATKWKTARTLTIGSTGKSVDGSGNVSWSLSEIGAAPASHTHDSLEMKTLTASTIDTTAGTYGFKGTGLLGNTSADWAGFQVDASNDRFQLIANSQLLFRQNDESTMAGNWSAWVGCITPNNVSATSGIKVTKTTSSVGTGDGSLTYYSGVKIEHDVSTSADTTNTGTLSHGGTFTAITSVTRDSYGHVKTLNTKTYTLPGSGDTDTKVTQTAVGSTYTNYRPLVISASNADSAPPTATTVTDGTFITSSIYCQPSSGSVYATKFVGPLDVSRVTKDSKAFPGANKAIIEEYAAGSTYNLPSNHYYHIISIQGPDTKFGTQLALGMTTTGAYYRNYNNQTWSDWKSIINSNTTYGISGAYGDSNNNTWKTTLTAGGSGTSSTVPTSSTSAYGITKLYNGVDSTSTGLAATANAVKTAYDKADHSHPYLPLAGGTMNASASITIPSGTGNIIYDGGTGLSVHAPTNSGWARGIDYYVGSTWYGGFGGHGSGGTFDSLYIGKYNDKTVQIDPINKITTFNGVVKLMANQYDVGETTKTALNCNNSNITGINSLIFNDASENAGEGILFYRSATPTWDGIWAKDGLLYFSPNYPTSSDNLSMGIFWTASNTDAWSSIGVGLYSTERFQLKIIRTGAANTYPSWMGWDYSAAIAFGGADTKGVISMHFNEPGVMFIGGQNDSNHTKPNWNFGISGTSGTTYNLANISNTGFGYRTLNATTVNTTAGSFVFGGDALLGGINDWAGIQVEGNNDRFQLLINGHLMVRQNDDATISAAGWTAWTSCLRPADVSGSGGITVTQNDVTVGSGSTASTYKGTVTISHSNSITASTSTVFKKFSYDANGHITGTANVAASDLPSHTHSQYYDSTLSRTANTVLAAPNGSNGAATFRKLVAADIPALNYVPFETVTTDLSANTYFTKTAWVNWNKNSGTSTTNLPTSNWGILLTKALPSVQVWIPDNASGIYFRRKADANTDPSAWWGLTGTAENTYNLSNMSNTGLGFKTLSSRAEIDATDGSFIFGTGALVIGSGADWVGFQADAGYDRFQLIPYGASLLYREDDDPASQTSTWGDFKALQSLENVTGSGGITVTHTSVTIGTGSDKITFNSGAEVKHSNNITAGTAKGDNSKTLTFGGTFTIPSITYDANGHITTWTTTTMTMPSNPNSDTKVNVTLATTSKAYLLGTTTTPTGTAQGVTSVADTGVYLTTTAGELCAKKFMVPIAGSSSGYWGYDKGSRKYPLICDNGTNLWIGSEATSSSTHHKGETYISTGWEGTLPTSKGTLYGNRTIYISIPYYTVPSGGTTGTWGGNNYAVYHTGYAPESYLTWGDKNFTGSNGVIDACLNNALGANRFELAKAAGITIDDSSNSGSSWTTATDTDSQKRAMFCSSVGRWRNVGNTSTAGMGTNASKYMTRVTLDSSTGSIYSVINKLMIHISTNGSTGCWMAVQIRSKTNVDGGNDLWQTWNVSTKSWGTATTSNAGWAAAATHFTLSGWSGWNVLNIADFTLGNSTSSHYKQIRFIFGCASNPTPASGSGSYSGFQLHIIQGYGGFGWTTPSNLATHGHVYTWDGNENTTFPANVTATKFIGPLQGNADTATSASELYTHYAAGIYGNTYALWWGSTTDSADPTSNYARRNGNATIKFRSDANGWAEIYLGNALETGTEGSSVGWLGLYSPGTGCHNLSGLTTNTELYHYFPSVGGTLLNSGNYSDYAVPYLGNLQDIGSGTPAAATKTYFDSSSVPTLRISGAYNNNGAEYGLIFAKGGSNSYGSVLRWGYSNTYIQILRKSSGTWQSTDWEKISAGYADKAGSITTESGSSAGARPVFYAYLGDTSRVVYNTNFTYNPSGGVLQTEQLALKSGSYTTTIQRGTTTANRTLVLPDKSGGIPVANILYEDDTGAHSYKVADAKNYKYFIITVHHGSFENQTGTIVPTTLSTTTHCYFTISFIDPTSAGNIRVGTADIMIAPDSSTNSITFTASASSHHLAIAGNSSSLTNITTSSPTSMVIRKIVGFM